MKLLVYYLWVCVMKDCHIQVPSNGCSNLATQVLVSLEHLLLPMGTLSVVNRCMHKCKYTPHQQTSQTPRTRISLEKRFQTLLEQH